jgi:CTP:molybdopterin cytidylyltransferase MocA
MPTALTLVAVLAAGAGSRFYGPKHKLQSLVGDASVLDRAVASAVSSRVGPVVVVTGTTAFALPPEVTVLTNPHWDQGLASSLQVALAHARTIGASSLVVGLGDQPFITADAWAAVARSVAPIAVATYDGVRANPVKIDAACFDALPTEGDEGARAAMRRHPDWVEEVPCTGTAFDVDTEQDLAYARGITNERTT